MKKCILMLCVLFVKASSFDFAGATETEKKLWIHPKTGKPYDLYVEVSEPTLLFIEWFCGDDMNAESLNDLCKDSCQTIGEDLERISNGNFSYEEFKNLSTDAGKIQYIEDKVITPAEKGCTIFTHGDNEFHMNGQIKNSCFKNVKTDSKNVVNSGSSCIQKGALLKASCAATVAGLATYYAIGFYNKDKSKEHHYSQTKWALGIAAIAGVGTFLYVR